MENKSVFEYDAKISKLKKENEKLKALNVELLEALQKIISINAAPTLELLIDKLKDTAKAVISKAQS